jgi:cytochrome P450
MYSFSHDFIDFFVKQALAKEGTNSDSKGENERYVFLAALVAQTRDPIELRSQLLNILLAGRDTTASLLGWLFFCLAQDPARYKKLRNRVIDDFGTYDNPRDITFETLKSCQYLQYSLSEALRVLFSTRMPRLPLTFLIRCTP